MTRRQPQARGVSFEDTIVVHRTHDRALAAELAAQWWRDNDPGRDVPDWIGPQAGDRTWLRCNPARPGQECAFWYALAAWEGQRGSFRAVVFTGESIQWWPKEAR